MRALFFASLLVLFLPLSACDSTGVDSGEPCYSCGANGGDGGHPGDNGGNGGSDNGGDNNGGDDGNGGDNNGGDGNGGDGDNGGDDKARFVEVDPMATYLRVSLDVAEDNVRAARAVPLSEIGLEAGKPGCFRAVGDFFYTGNVRASSVGDPLIVAVFSRDEKLGDRNDLNRVTGAIDAGDDIVTDNTFLGDQRTDIGEDFAVTDVCLTVPDGAEFIFFSANDNAFNDNTDVRENGQAFGVRVEK